MLKEVDMDSTLTRTEPKKKRRFFTEAVSNFAIVLMLATLCLVGFGGSGAYDTVFSAG